MIKLFGTTFGGVANVLFGGAHLGPSKADKIKAYGQVIVTICLVVVGCFLVMANTGQSQSIGASVLGS